MKYPPSFYRHKKDEIKDRMESDNLVIERKENKASIIEKDWIYSFSNENINDLSPTFFLYMNTSPQEFMDILRILHKNKWDIYQFDDFTITFDHADFDDYDFVFTDNSLKTDTSDSQIRRIGIIDEGIYWRKKEEIKTEE